MRRILVAVDESDASKRAATFVDGFFRRDEVTLTAVNVARVPIEWMPPTPWGAVYAWPYDEAESGRLEDALARQQREGEVVAAAQAPHDADVEVVFGETVDAILTAADDQDADLIVVGSNDKGFLRRLFEGSVSEQVTRRSTRPVLVVP
jgi:nucleotide-binding universal stress UspA family protein